MLSNIHYLNSLNAYTNDNLIKNLKNLSNYLKNNNALQKLYKQSTIKKFDGYCKMLINNLYEYSKSGAINFSYLMNLAKSYLDKISQNIQSQEIYKRVVTVFNGNSLEYESYYSGTDYRKGNPRKHNDMKFAIQLYDRIIISALTYYCCRNYIENLSQQQPQQFQQQQPQQFQQQQPQQFQKPQWPQFQQPQQQQWQQQQQYRQQQQQQWQQPQQFQQQQPQQLQQLEQRIYNINVDNITSKERPEQLRLLKEAEEEFSKMGKVGREMSNFCMKGITSARLAILQNTLSFGDNDVDADDKRKKAILFLQNCLSFSGSSNVRKARGYAVGQLLYNNDGTLKEDLVNKLLKGVKPPQTISSKDINEDIKYGATKNMPDGSNAYKAAKAIYDNNDIGIVDDRYVPSDKTIETYDPILKKNGAEALHIIMVASQTNGLESVNTGHSLVSQYPLDQTQGPCAALIDSTATIKREHEYQNGELKKKDTVKPIIDVFSGGTDPVIERVGDEPKEDIGTYIPTKKYRNDNILVKSGYDTGTVTSKKFICIGKEDIKKKDNWVYPFYRNGYKQPYSLKKAGREKLFDAMASLKSLYMSQECKEQGVSEKPHIQNFASAISYQDFRDDGGCLIDDEVNCYTDNDKENMTLQNNLINFRWIYPQYDNIIKDAIRQSIKMASDGNNNKLIMVHLTRIGQGVFDNPVGVQELAIAMAIYENMEKLNDSNIIIQKEWPPKTDFKNAVEFISSIVGMNMCNAETCKKILGEHIYGNLAYFYQYGGGDDLKYLFDDRSIVVSS